MHPIKQNLTHREMKRVSLCRIITGYGFYCKVSSPKFSSSLVFSVESKYIELGSKWQTNSIENYSVFFFFILRRNGELEYSNDRFSSSDSSYSIWLLLVFIRRRVLFLLIDRFCFRCGGVVFFGERLSSSCQSQSSASIDRCDWE